MKWFSIIPVLAVAFLASACEKHLASELPEEGATAFGEHAAGASAEKPDVKSAGDAAAQSGTPAPPADAKPGEAPKFFPETK